MSTISVVNKVFAWVERHKVLSLFFLLLLVAIFSKSDEAEKAPNSVVAKAVADTWCLGGEASDRQGNSVSRDDPRAIHCLMPNPRQAEIDRQEAAIVRTSNPYTSLRQIEEIRASRLLTARQETEVARAGKALAAAKELVVARPGNALTSRAAAEKLAAAEQLVMNCENTWTEWARLNAIVKEARPIVERVEQAFEQECSRSTGAHGVARTCRNYMEMQGEYLQKLTGLERYQVTYRQHCGAL